MEREMIMYDEIVGAFYILYQVDFGLSKTIGTIYYAQFLV
jgi:hypothetical protein